jgi:hypothetical protein
LGGRAVGVGFSLIGELGARINTWAGAVLGLGFSATFFSVGRVLVFSFAPGFRLGGRAHFTLTLGPAIAMITLSGLGSGVGLVGTLGGTGVFPVAGPFSLIAQAGLSFDTSGAFFNASAGLGVNF